MGAVNYVLLIKINYYHGSPTLSPGLLLAVPVSRQIVCVSFALPNFHQYDKQAKMKAGGSIM